MKLILCTLLVFLGASGLCASGASPKTPTEMEAISVLTLEASVAGFSIPSVYEDELLGGAKIRTVDVIYNLSDVSVVKNVSSYSLPEGGAEVLKTRITLSPSFKGDNGVSLEVGSRYRFYFEAIMRGDTQSLELHLVGPNSVTLLRGSGFRTKELLNRLEEIKEMQNVSLPPLFTRERLERRTEESNARFRQGVMWASVSFVIVGISVLLVLKKRHAKIQLRTKLATSK